MIEKDASDGRAVRATLKDVAAYAGVSLTTISLYLSGNTHVCSRETADRIVEGIYRVNYARGIAALNRDQSAERADSNDDSSGSNGGTATSRRATAARTGESVPASGASEGTSFPLRRMRAVGLAIPSSDRDLLDPLQPARSDLSEAVWLGASQMAEWEDRQILLYPASMRNSPDPAPFLDGSISSLILASISGDPRPALLAAAGLPVVLLNRCEEIPDGCGAVFALEDDVAQLALSHLWGLGHRRIAYLAGPTLTPQASDIATRRLERYRVWLRVRGVGDDTLVLPGTSWDGHEDEARLREGIEAMFTLPHPPTAFFCASNALALRLITHLRALGLSVPNDISVVGVGDSAEARGANPALSCVQLPGEEMGREAVRLALRLAEGMPAEGAKARVAVPVTRFAARDTTATLTGSSPIAEESDAMVEA
ncbi:MAG: LacI family DNA-binding transcriptional regulator [Cytophagales bacterium]|nr:LacI family DNA-binding transcriptional regulator [Armatimonadota bacterium]